MALHIVLSSCFGFIAIVRKGFDVSRIKNVLCYGILKLNSDKSFGKIHINWNGIRGKTNCASVMKSLHCFHSKFLRLSCFSFELIEGLHCHLSNSSCWGGSVILKKKQLWKSSKSTMFNYKAKLFFFSSWHFWDIRPSCDSNRTEVN